MRSAACLVTLLLALPWTALAALPDVEVEGHPVRASIQIRGDGDLTPENGVRSGSGTANDPFVIEDWTVVSDTSDALLIEGTRAHLVVRDLVERWGPPSSSQQGRFAALRFMDAQNVTVERVHLDRGAHAVLIEDSASIVVRDVRAEPSLPDPTDYYESAVEVLTSHDVRLERVAVAEVGYVGGIYRSDNVTIVDSSFVHPHESLGAIHIAEARDVTIQGSVFDASLSLGSGVRSLRLIRNEFDLRSDEFLDWGDVDGALVCGNTFRGKENALHLLTMTHVRVAGNSFDGAHILLADARDVLVDHNSFAGGPYGVWFWDGAPVLRDNAITGHTSANRLSADADARHNWWGHASGPSGAGPGSGDAVGGPGAEFAPWLTTPPETTADCDAIPTPIPTPLPPPPRVDTLQVDGAWAGVVHVPPHPGTPLDIRASWALGNHDGDAVPTLSYYVYDPDDPTGGQLVTPDHYYPDFVEAEVGTAPGLPHVTVALTTLYDTAAIQFHDDGTSTRGLDLVVWFTGEMPILSSTFETSQPADGTTVVAWSTWKSGQRSFPDFAPSASATVLGWGGSARVASEARVTVEHGFLGYSDLDTGLLDPVVVSFTYDGPAGAGPATAHTFRSDPAGAYTFRLTEASAPMRTRPYVTWVDVDLTTA